MVFFSKFGKTVKDLFKTDKYELDRTVSLKCTSKNTEWTSEFSFPISEEGKSSDKAIYKQKFATFGSVEIEVPSLKPKKFDYQLPNFKEGVKVNLVVEEEKATDSRGQKESGCAAKFSLKGEYALGGLAGKICAESGNNTVINAELAHEYREGCWAGGEVKYTASSAAVVPDMGFSAGAHFPMGDIMFDGKADFTNRNLNVKLHKPYSSGAAATEFNYDYQNHQTTTSVGGVWNVDDNCDVQGFVKNTGNAYLLFKYKLTAGLTASAGTSFNLSNLQQDRVNIHYKINIDA